MYQVKEGGKFILPFFIITTTLYMSICILTTLFNRSKISYSFKSFLQFIKDSKAIDDLFICEITKNGQSKISSLGLKNHYVLENPDPVWHKECGINYLLNKLPKKYDKVIVADNDIVLNDKYWLIKTEKLLKDSIMVQPYDEVRYLGPNNIGIDKYYHSMISDIETGQNNTNANPGLIVAYTRDYLYSVGGLFDKCLVGGGDSVNITPFIKNSSYVSFDIFDRVFFDDRYSIIDYLFKAKNYINNSNLKKYSYIEGCSATHFYHGMINHRSYGDRYNLINQRLRDESMVQDANGLYRIKHSILKQDLKNFFNNRLSINIASRPVIYNTNKYKIESNNILWLSDYNYIQFYNIKKVKIKLAKNHFLKYTNIIGNNTKIDCNFVNNCCEIEINNPKTLIVDSDYFIPKQINDSKDIRKLSVYIVDIEVMKINTDQYEKYRLQDIL